MEALTPPLIYHKALTLCRRLYRKSRPAYFRPLDYEEDADVVNQYIYDLLMGDKPCMIGRFGANELNLVFNYLGITEHRGDALGYVTCKTGPWWWNRQIVWQMEHCAGFFPTDDRSLRRFCQMTLEDTPLLDVVGCWLNEEQCVKHLMQDAYKVAFTWLSPWFSKKPWSWALEGKRVLVVHPFDGLIRQQYEKRHLLFGNNLLPTFSELHTVKAVMSFADNSASCGFPSWFDALKWMEDEMDKIDYDVCILGCGAYGFPLAAHAKRMGKKAIHLGGNSQILFGIYGKAFLLPNRWEYERHGIPSDFYRRLINEHWVRPGDEYKPKSPEQVDNASYW
jgi:hypothetical protein